MTAVLAKVQDAVEAIEKKSIRKGETVRKKLPLVWRFPWSLDHFYNLMRFSTEGCEDSHTKKPKDIRILGGNEDFF